MFLRFSATSLFFAALAAPAAASEPAPRPESRDQAPHAGRQAEVELVCRSVETAGGQPAPMVCMTAADWRRANQ